MGETPAGLLEKDAEIARMERHNAHLQGRLMEEYAKIDRLLDKNKTGKSEIERLRKSLKIVQELGNEDGEYTMRFGWPDCWPWRARKGK